MSPYFFKTKLHWFIPLMSFLTLSACEPAIDIGGSDYAGGASLIIELPFAPGVEKMCTQGAHGTHSHNSDSTRYDLDLDTDNYSNEQVFAPIAGVARVHMNSASSGFGYHINIDLGNGTYVLVAHLSDIFVSDGDEVAAGSLLGYEGKTGDSTGDHVHIGLHQGDASQSAENGISIPTTYRAANQSTGTGITSINSEDFSCGIMKQGDPYDGDYYRSDLPINLWHPDGVLVKTPDNARVYVIDDGAARWIQNEEVFWDMGYSFDEVVLISREEADCLGTGEEILSAISVPKWGDLREGDLVTESDASDVYAVAGGYALPIKNWDVYILMGFLNRAITVVSPGEVGDILQVGNCVADVLCLDHEAVTTCGGGMDLTGGSGSGGSSNDDDEPDDEDENESEDEEEDEDEDEPDDEEEAEDEEEDEDEDEDEPEDEDEDEEEEEEEEEEEPDDEPEDEPEDEDEEEEDEDEEEETDDESTLTIEVDYPSNYPSLALSVQPIFAISSLGDYWSASESVTNNDEVSWSDTGDYSGLLGVRLNVSVDSDGNGSADDWYCYGHYASAFLEYGVAVDITLDEDSWDENDLVTWSPGSESDTSLGCSALLWFGNTDEISVGAVY